MNNNSNTSYKRVFRVLGGLIGLVSALLGIYAFIYQEKVTEIQYEILGNTNVLDINANLNKLDVLYDSTSLKAQNLNLKIYTLRVKNSGNTCILKDYYDDDDPLGLEIKNGKIIELPKLYLVSNEYFKRNLKIQLTDGNKMTFNKVIFEEGEFYVINFLVLHKKGITPILKPIGKIANLKTIKLTDLINSTKPKESFFSRTFSGNFFVQITRGISYGILLILILILIVFVVDNLFSSTDNNDEREKHITHFKEKYHDVNFNSFDEYIFTIYITLGFVKIYRLYDILKDEKQIKEILAFTGKDEIPKSIKEAAMSKYSEIHELINNGFLQVNRNDVVINTTALQTLELLIIFLKENYANKSELTIFNTRIHTN